MIRAEQIPDEVVEAAAKVIADTNGWREKHSVSICKPVAAEAIAAAINAWPGAWRYGNGFMPPLPCNSVVPPLAAEGR